MQNIFLDEMLHNLSGKSDLKVSQSTIFGVRALGCIYCCCYLQSGSESLLILEDEIFDQGRDSLWHCFSISSIDLISSLV